MKPEQIVALGVRLFALIVVFYAIREGIESIAYYGSDSSDSLYPYFSAGLMLLMLLVAVILWRFPLTISSNLLGFRRTDNTQAPPITASQLQIVGFTLLGFYLLSRVLSTAVSWLVLWFITQRSHTPLHLTDGQVAGLIATGVELAFALFLMFGAQRIDAFLLSKR